MPFEYGTPRDELGPDNETLRPTLRSAANAAPVVMPRARAAPKARRVSACMVVVSGSDASGEKLDGGQGNRGVEQVDALEADPPTLAGTHQSVRVCAGQHQLALAAGFDIEKGRAQL